MRQGTIPSMLILTLACFFGNFVGIGFLCCFPNKTNSSVFFLRQTEKYLILANKAKLV